MWLLRLGAPLGTQRGRLFHLMSPKGGHLFEGASLSRGANSDKYGILYI